MLVSGVALVREIRAGDRGTGNSGEGAVNV